MSKLSEVDVHTHPLLLAITAEGQPSKVGALERFCKEASYDELLQASRALHGFAQDPNGNVYQRVRALLQLHALYRYFLPERAEAKRPGHIPHAGRVLLLDRRFTEAIHVFLAQAESFGMNDSLASALSVACHGLGFQILAGQVQRAVRSVRGNRWMFRTSHAFDYPLRLRRELLERDASGVFPLLIERTPVRMDLSHSGWSDIFFLGMDYPEGARVLNVSVDLGVLGRDQSVSPPITCSLRVIEVPVLRLTSVDLGATVDITETSDVFDVARDYLGLLRAAVIASGLVPSGLEGTEIPIGVILETLVGPGLGLELVTQVNDIPKGSRLAVSTNLLAGSIAVCMRATSQIACLSGRLSEAERRVVAGRAILGEWLGGSGGGWQDSGGLWPGAKLIEGVVAEPNDIEFGSSHGRLLPRHTLLGADAISDAVLKKLSDSLVIVHGGMAANVGPILEMVTEKFLIGTTQEWRARQELLQSFDAILRALREGDLRELGRLTTRNFRGALQTIIPWVSNFYTERLIAAAESAFGDRFWGFWMLGGMSGGGMGFIFDPAVKAEAEGRMLEIMRREKQQAQAGLPFAMDPVVYRFGINNEGTTAEIRTGSKAILSSEYYLMMLPRWLSAGSKSFSGSLRRELELFSRRDLSGAQAERIGPALLRKLLPSHASEPEHGESLEALLERHGFDRQQHEKIREDLLSGRIGLAKNRLPVDSIIEDVKSSDVTRSSDLGGAEEAVGREALLRGEVCVVSLAAGVGSRWTQGAGTVKALHPFARMGGRFRTFLEVHLAKSRRAGRLWGRVPGHVITSSHLTHAALSQALERENYYGLASDVRLSQGRVIGLRLVPTLRDLEFAWEEMQEQKLEARKQKVRKSARAALMDWARSQGEATDYTDNLPSQCLHPVGHWYEVANLLLNGTLRALLAERPQLKYLMLHNIDTLGAVLEPRLLGHHVRSGATLTFEVITRRYEDRGGGLARVGGRVRLVEGLALPREEDESKLTYYNSMTTWISVDALLSLFGLERAALSDDQLVRTRVRALGDRVPTYITLKDVKRRWGNAQEDVFPVAQFEKLWGDMSALPDAHVGFVVVPRERGQQLKDVAQLDGWVQDGSQRYIESLCDFG